MKQRTEKYRVSTNQELIREDDKIDKLLSETIKGWGGTHL